MWTLELLPPAHRELAKLPDDLQARFLWVSELLLSHGPQTVGDPYVKHLRGKLWEMRLTGRDGIARAIYFAATGKRLVVVRMFEKKTQKTPQAELELAAKRMKDWNRDN
jgi:phage-related protein